MASDPPKDRSGHVRKDQSGVLRVPDQRAVRAEAETAAASGRNEKEHILSGTPVLNQSICLIYLLYYIL